MLVPKSTMIITSSGKLSRARVKQKYLDGGIIDLQAPAPLRAVSSEG
jgi:fatty-acyl-CoA synthase